MTVPDAALCAVIVLSDIEPLDSNTRTVAPKYALDLLSTVPSCLENNPPLVSVSTVPVEARVPSLA